MNFFSKILKHKKVAVFIFLLFFTTIFAVPQIAFAGWFSFFEGWFGDAMSGLFNALVAGFLFIPLFLTAVMADIAGALLSFTISLATAGISYTNSVAVNLGWPVVRDLANMIIVLGFVIIGIAFALRIESYGSKKVLINLIIAAILINFSLVICGIFIDGTNIVTTYFFNSAGSRGLFAQSVKDAYNMVTKIFEESWTEFGVGLLAMTAFNFFAFFIYLLYILLLLCRIIAIWMLVILSPLAFVCSVFPATKNIWQMWWKNFFQWCIIGIPAGLFYFIGAKMIDTMTSSSTMNEFRPTFNTIPSLAQTVMNSWSLLIPGLFLVIGFFVSLQFSASGAGAIMNFANKYKGTALKGGLGALTKASRAAGGIYNNTAVGKKAAEMQARGNWRSLSGWGNKIGGGLLGAPGAVIGGFVGNAPSRIQRAKSGLVGLAEKAGAVEPGAAGVLEGKELKENQARMSALIAQGRLAEVNAIAEGKGVGANSMERGAAIGALLKSKNFDFENEAHKAGISHFRKHGGDIGEYSDKEPGLAGYDLSAIRNTLAKENTTAKITVRGRPITEDEAKDMVEEKAHVKHLVETKIEDINIDILKRAPIGAFRKAGDKFSTEKVKTYKEFVTPNTRAFKAFNDEISRLLTELARQGITPEERTKLNKQLQNLRDSDSEIRSW